MKTFVSQAGLARRLGRSENLIAARLRARGVAPDGILIRETKCDTLLFATERVNELRVLLGGGRQKRGI
jgi:hypothetical protein